MMHFNVAQCLTAFLWSYNLQMSLECHMLETFIIWEQEQSLLLDTTGRYVCIVTYWYDFCLAPTMKMNQLADYDLLERKLYWVRLC